MLRFHVLNVGQGDSIVIEHDDGSERSFGVIDSNCAAGETPKALEKLEELGADRLSFVCLTHPHRDHYRGLSQILNRYEGNIDQFLMFPAGEFIGANTKQLATKYRKIAKTQDDQSITMDSLEFVRILMFAHKNSEILECTGPYNNIALQGFSGTQLHGILPLPMFKGSYLERIRDDDPSIFENEKENDLSLALQFHYKGVSVLFGGDATHKNWSRRLALQKTRDLKTVHSIAVKLPHHGSELDCTKDMLDVAYSDDDFSEEGAPNRYAFISANGAKHPHESVLQELQKRGIKPYCTNLHKSCGANVHHLLDTAGVVPLLGKYINQMSMDGPQKEVCQGNIIFTIEDNGDHHIDRETRVPCDLRGELDDLFATAG